MDSVSVTEEAQTQQRLSLVYKDGFCGRFVTEERWLPVNNR